MNSNEKLIEILYDIMTKQVLINGLQDQIRYLKEQLTIISSVAKPLKEKTPLEVI